MLSLAALALSYAPALRSGPALPAAARAVGPAMQANRKVYAFDNEGVFEAREVSVKRQPVYLLSAVEELRVATGVADTGLLSAAEDAGVFSKLESVGAFSLAEKALPVVEDLKLLTLFEKLLNVEWGLQFSIAGFVLVSAPVLFTLQICGFVPFPDGPAVAFEGLFALSTVTAGGAGIVTALLISKLQL